MPSWWGILQEGKQLASDTNTIQTGKVEGNIFINTIRQIITKTNNNEDTPSISNSTDSSSCVTSSSSDIDIKSRDNIFPNYNGNSSDDDGLADTISTVTSFRR